MVTFFEASLDTISVHHVGNPSHNEFYALSNKPLELKDEVITTLLMQYFLKPFEKANEVYHLMHSSGELHLNELHHFATQLFEDKEKFHEVSEQITKYLHKVSNHPNIKTGELYVVYFKKVQIEGNPLDAIGIFKSENKETYLKVYPQDGGFNVDYEENAININKLDKGVLIFNIEKENGYKVVVIDKSNTSQEAAVYWKDDFLQLKIRNDSFNQTSNTLGIYKNFVTQKLDDEFEMSKADKIDLLNRSMKYFKEKETFDMDEFAGEVIGNEKAIESFKNFKSQYEQEFDSPIADTFEISNNAVKKQARDYKSVLKLDKNFHIYIHGDKELIEKGFDDGRAMNFYKVYFKEEA
ncbi:nucleoid-associated protein [Mucilaginibacter sp. L196]|uniref:nucleoid-associated protein n=1 Tax=Mucilaginibacter sp. L196 TaxID=1641870 RepID=UPI00131B0E68|nr:nucleoid-associated protein [Mucilaginibacter sp. L196]